MNPSGEITNYVYHLYGDDETLLTEAAYSIGTLLKRSDPKKTRIVFYTDRPEKIRSWPVICESIAGQIDEMKGPLVFGFRIKLCCLLKCAGTFPGNIVHMDTDTIVQKPVQKLVDKLGKGRAVMYCREILGNRFPHFDGFQMQFPDGLKYGYGPESRMFNAGVIGIHRDDLKILKAALAMCDALLLQGKRDHAEQFAMSEALRIYGLKILEARSVVAHYYRISATKYMEHQFQKLASRSKTELWNLGRPIPYSYPRIQLFKLMEKFRK